MLEKLKKGTGPIRIVAPDKRNRITPVFGAAPFDERAGGFKIGGELYPAKLERDDKGRGEHRMVSLSNHEIQPGTVGKAAPVQIDNFSSYSFMHNDHYARNDSELFMLAIGIECGFIAESKAAFNPLYNRFYIDDAEAESKARASKADLVYEAMSALRDMTQKEQASLAFVLKKPVLKMTADMIEAALKEAASDTPQKILDLVSNVDYKYDVFLQRLIAHGIISQREGKYFDENNCIGVDADNAKAYLKEPSNQTFVDQWQRIMKDKEVGVIAQAASSEEIVANVPEVDDSVGADSDVDKPKTDD